MNHLKNLLQWVSIPAVVPSAHLRRQSNGSQDPINLSEVTEADRERALLGPAAALLIEARHYGLSLCIRDGRLFIRGKPPPSADDFIRRLKLSRREVGIALDSLNRGWRVKWRDFDSQWLPDNDEAAA